MTAQSIVHYIFFVCFSNGSLEILKPYPFIVDSFATESPYLPLSHLSSNFELQLAYESLAIISEIRLYFKLNIQVPEGIIQINGLKTQGLHMTRIFD